MPHEAEGSTRLSRRQFLAGAAGAIAAQALPEGLIQIAQATPTPVAALPEQPNMVLIITDQERYPRHWPAGWADTNLPNRKRLADSGLTFSNAYCNSCMCSPSRSTLFTGTYPAQHGVVDTLTSGGTESAGEQQLPLTIQNMARVLASAGYNVHYRGKWHLSKGEDGGKPTSAGVAAYGFQGWVAPDAGEDTDVENFGGGDADNDLAYAQQAVDFLASQANATQPFALIVSFVNPHDVLAYPRTYDQDATYTADSTKFSQGILYTDIPSRNEDLSTKPTAHAQTLTYLNVGLGVLVETPQEPARRNYVNFYAYLQKVVDVHIGSVLDALETNGLRNSTIVIRTSDHGELGLAHGGLRQKMFNAYQETINVPLVISNPLLFPSAQTTSALASLVDILPTMASFAGVLNDPQWSFKGFDLSPIILGQASKVQDEILFTFDDEKAGAQNGQSVVTQPNHIRCIVDGRWKFARYFDPSGVEEQQEELYDLESDPHEMNNLASSNTAQRNSMAARLAAIEAQRLGPLFQVALPQVVVTS